MTTRPQPWYIGDEDVLIGDPSALASGAWLENIGAPQHIAHTIWLTDINITAEPSVLHVASHDYRTKLTDSPASVQYRGDLSKATALRYRRRVSFWPWSRPVDPTSGRASRGSLGSGELVLDNAGGRYDGLLGQDNRDQAITSRTIQRRTIDDADDLADSVLMLHAIIETTQVRGDTVRMVLTDPIAKLDKMLQQDSFDPDSSDEGVADKTVPTLIGLARNIPAVMWQGVERRLRVTDGPLSGVGVVRDRYIALNPLADPPQWTFDTSIGNAGVKLQSDPVGVVTLDASTSGDSILPPSPVDVLSGNGEFDQAFTGGAYTYFGYDPTGGSDDNFTASDVALPPGWQSYSPGNVSAQFLGAYRVLQVAGGGLRLLNGPGAGQHQSLRTAQLMQAGKTYRWRLELVERITGGNLALGQKPRLIVRLHPRNQQRLFFADNATPAGVYSGSVTIPGGVADQAIQIYIENQGTMVTVNSITLFEVLDPPEVELAGITLTDYAREVVLQRAKLPEDAIDLDSFKAIDEAFKGSDDQPPQIGMWFGRAVTALTALRGPLDSYAADVYTTRAGVVRVARLRDPALDAGNAQAVLTYNSASFSEAFTDGSFTTSCTLNVGSVSYRLCVRLDVQPAPNDIYVADTLSELSDADVGERAMRRTIAAINGTGVPGVEVGAGTDPHPDVTAEWAVNELANPKMRAVAQAPGADGNGISVSFIGPNFFDAPGSWDGNELSGGIPKGLLLIDAGRLARAPVPQPDLAPGLTTTATARTNWYRASSADFAEGVPQADREQYKAQGQIYVKATNTDNLPAQYRHAIGADPLPTVFDTRAAAVQSLDSVVNLYRKLRHFYPLEVRLHPHETIDMDQVVILQYPRFDLAPGKPLLVVDVDDENRGAAHQRICRIMAWG